jgi:hypothetical protein
MIYTNVNWWNPCTGSSAAFGTYLLDVSSCNSSPPAVPGWGTNWTLWQYNIPDCGRGATRDWDVFNGSYAQLAQLAGQAGGGSTGVVGSRAMWYHDGSLQVFQRGADNSLRHWYYLGGWHDDGAVPNAAIANPPTAIEYLGQLHVFAQAASGNTLQHSWWDAGWRTENLGGSVVGTPTTALYSDGTLQVFARGTDGRLRHWYYTNTWTYESLGDAVSGDPVAIEYLGQLHVFARTSNMVFHRWYDHGWYTEILPGYITGDPAAALWGRQLHVFARGQNGAMLHNWQDGGWYTETLPGGTVNGRPVALADPNDGLLHVFARGNDDHLQQWYYANGWNYEQFSDVITGYPSATVYGTQLQVFAREPDSSLHHNWWDPGARAWFREDLGGSFAPDPAG